MEVEAGGVTKEFLDFVLEDGLCFCESGDEEYLKERGTSILKRRVRARDASGGNADDVDSYYQIGRVALRTVQSRADSFRVSISKNTSWALMIATCGPRWDK